MSTLTHEESRSRLIESRRHIEDVMAYAEHLAPAERDLLHGVFNCGMTREALARIGRVSSTTLGRRVHRLLLRINSAEFRYVLRMRETWPRVRCKVGDRVILRGETLRDTARDLKLSLHRIRQEMHVIRTLAREDAEGVQHIADNHHRAHRDIASTYH